MQHLSRNEFIEDYFDYRPGEHLNIISPTGGGKSYLLNQLQSKVIRERPYLRVVNFMPKLRDETTEKYMHEMRLKEIKDWPPSKRFWESEPNGYVLWPDHNVLDETANREHLSSVFKRGINAQYADGDSLTLVDDAYVIGVLYGMNPELDRHWIAGRSNNAGLWTSLQKPSGTTGGAISSFAYNSPTHLFLGKDGDDRNLKRFSEIDSSDLDPRELESIVRGLKVHRIGDSAVSEMLYIDRRGDNTMAVIGV